MGSQISRRQQPMKIAVIGAGISGLTFAAAIKSIISALAQRG